MINFIVCSCLLPTFALDPVDEKGDRLGIVGTILLTAVAFQTYVSGLLPTVPYLTLVEYYLLASDVYIAIVNSLLAYSAYYVTYKCND